MELKLKRIAKREDYTIGRLLINDKYFCDTLEDPVRELKDRNSDGDFDDVGEGKINNHTAIPAGKYKIISTYSNKFKKNTPILLDVPGFTGIRIHSGNTSADTSGCILVGLNKEKGKVLNSREWTQKIYTLIFESLSRNELVTIDISNH